MHNTILWITLANALYLASYSVRDILWLRMLTVVAAILLIPYYLLQPTPLTAAIYWNLLFIGINVYWIVRLILERQPVSFTPDEAQLRVLSFPSLTQREARELFRTGIWEDIDAGASLVQHDNRSDRFSVILRGLADVVHHAKKIAELGEGQFVGAIDVQADHVDMDVVVRKDVRVMCWSRKVLVAFIAKRPDVALALERSVGVEVQRLLGSALSKLDATDSHPRAVPYPRS